MLVSYIVRGNVVEWVVDFIDADGIQVDPSSAFVYINYLVGDERFNETIELEMDESDGVWRGIWPTAGVDPARVYWSVQSENPVSVKDGFFDLTANLANMNAAVTP